MVRVGYSMIIFLPVSFFHFISTLIYDKIPKKFIAACYAVGLFFLVSLWTSNGFISGYYVYYWGAYPKASFLHPLYLTFLTFLVIKILHSLWNKHKTSVDKGPLKLVFWALLTYTLAAIDFLVNYGVEFYPFGVCFIMISVVLLSYAIMAFNVLNMSVRVQSGLVQFLLLIAWLIPLGLFFFKLESFLEGPFLKTILLAMLILVAGHFIGRIKVRADFTLEQILFKKRHDYHSAIQKLNKKLVQQLNIHELLNLTITTLQQAMDIKEVFVLLKEKEALFVSNNRDKKILMLSHDVQKSLAKQVHFIKTTFLEEIQKIFSGLAAEVVIPLTHNDELTGLLCLGGSGTNYQFNQSDSVVFSQLASQLSIAVENAKAYKMISELNESLEKKVKERTLDLEQTLLELKSAQAQIIRSGKLAGVGTLAAGIAHEINNALNGALNCSFVLDRDLRAVIKKEANFDDVKNDVSNYLDTIRKEMNRTRTIVENLMRFSRKNSEGFKPDNIHDGINSTIQMLTNELRVRNIQIECDFCKTDLVYCNLSELNQVFFNIILNSLQAIEQNGKIKIKTWEDGDFFFVSITDNGPGIKKEHLDQIFDPFFTTKPVGKGTGLGLATSYNIVKDHSGEIDVQSNPEKGTTFAIKIRKNKEVVNEHKK